MFRFKDKKFTILAPALKQTKNNKLYSILLKSQKEIFVIGVYYNNTRIELAQVLKLLILSSTVNDQITDS